MHWRHLNMHAVEEGARLRCPSSWVQLGENICHGGPLLYFQYLAITNYAREITQLIHQGPTGQIFLIIVKTMSRIITLPKFQWEDFKSSGWKMCVFTETWKNQQVSQLLTILLVYYLIDISPHWRQRAWKLSWKQQKILWRIKNIFHFFSHELYFNNIRLDIKYISIL